VAEPDIFQQIGGLLGQGNAALDQPLAQKLVNFTTLWPVLSTLYIVTVLAAFGLGLLWFLIAPDRNRRAVQALTRAPLTSWLIGFGVVITDYALLAVLVKAQVQPGQALLGVLPLFMAALGLSVCARALGERVLPERGPVTHVALGLLALVLPLLSPAFVVIVWIAGPVGLGAWLRARK